MSVAEHVTFIVRNIVRPINCDDVIEIELRKSYKCGLISVTGRWEIYIGYVIDRTGAVACLMVAISVILIHRGLSYFLIYLS